MEIIEEAEQKLQELRLQLEAKRRELEAVLAETEQEYAFLQGQRELALQRVEPRLRQAYERIRRGVRNGRAIVPVRRGACDGCYNAVPPQRQLEIRQHNRIVICEHCGRILIDEAFYEEHARNLIRAQ